MKGLRLYKIEKLCSETAISRLFRREGPEVKSALCYPLRASWAVNGNRSAQCPQFLVSVPKKRMRHAVDRVTMRRRIREAYRLNRHESGPDSVPVDIAFIYVASELLPYARVESAVRKLLGRIRSGTDMADCREG